MLTDKPLSSPLEAVVFSWDGLTIPLWVQRDDQLHPLLSGNKYRKLQAFVRHDTAGYVSFGGAWSNHLLAVAALARMQGVRSIGYIRGEEERPLNTYERWLLQLGMEIRKVSRQAYADKARLYAQVASEHPSFQCIPEGGHPQPHGRAFDQWVNELPRDADHLLTSCGTGATLLGLAEALQQAQRSSRLWGVSAIHANQFIQDLQSNAQQLYPHVEVAGSLSGQRFGQNHPKELAIAKAFFDQTGIAPDPVYDSRLLAFLIQKVKKGSIKTSEKIVWLHSGGITGWAGYPSECHKLFGL